MNNLTEKLNDYLKDETINKLINSIVKPYRLVLDTDDIESCKSVGLWNALKTFSPSKKSSLNTYICNNVKWECGKALKNKKKQDRMNGELEQYQHHKKSDEKPINSDLLEQISLLPQEQRRIILLKLEKRSLSEIHRITKLSRFTVEKLYKIALSSLKDLIN